MLAHLRQRVETTLSSVQQANLATAGPAGILARIFPCEAKGIRLYLLVPSTSDHLFNLEHEPTAVVSTAEWQLYGRGRMLPLAQAPPQLLLPRSTDAPGCILVEIQPVRLQINHPQGWGHVETIDIDEYTNG